MSGHLLFLTFLFPLLGFAVLSFSRGKLAENVAALIGVGTIGGSAATAAYMGAQFLANTPPGGVYTEFLWNWISVGNFHTRFALHLDAVSLVMLGVITGVGFLIHLFASWYMRGEEGYARFFSYMNLFVASMLFLVLADNLLFLYFGWEGVGLCSYLLIGFYYKDPANGSAARKAFIVTRIGDTFMAIGLFLLYRELGTLDIQTVLAQAPSHWSVGAPTVTWIALLLLGGACGKSAQLPLQTWLPDAMAGPTPVSALIHAATMVTAGVYLIARTHTLYELSPIAHEAVGVVGAATLLLAGFTALSQTDIKRILAYSTMSQIGYMFLALGASAWNMAIFHLMTHAFFKALLFLASGAVILGCHHEQDIFKMGGLRKTMPIAFWSFMVGGFALMAFWPTAGYFSKDGILEQAYEHGHPGLWLAGTLGAFLTAVYTSRLLYVVFFGEEKTHAHGSHDLTHTIPLGLLMVASVVGGWRALDLGSVLPHEAETPVAILVKLAPLGVSIVGLGLGTLLFWKNPQGTHRFTHQGFPDLVRRYFYSAFGFDWLYDRLFVKPFYALVRLNKTDSIDRTMNLIPELLRNSNVLLVRTINGRLRWYAASFGVGAVFILAAVLRA